MNTFLNLGAGRSKPLELPTDKPYFLMNVDRMYKAMSSFKDDVGYNSLVGAIRAWHKFVNERSESFNSETPPWIHYVGEDIPTFLDTYLEQFQNITIYRYLEHIPWTKLGYFIYQVSQLVEQSGIVDIIVPNFVTLGERLKSLEEDLESGECLDSQWLENELIILNSEFVNEPFDPHQCMTSPQILHRAFTTEGRFKLVKSWPQFNYDGRDIYMRMIFKRI